jgi:anaerobic selenocysteine-containing dehydrogenase
VESPKGKIKARARLYNGTMPNVISIPFGEGHRSGGRWTTGLGENPYRLFGDDLDPFTGYPVKGSIRVKVYKA